MYDRRYCRNITDSVWNMSNSGIEIVGISCRF